MKQITAILADTFTQNFSHVNYCPKFVKYKEKKEAQGLPDARDDTTNVNNTLGIYNRINITELKNAIKACQNSNPGPDNVHISFIKSLLIEGLEYLLTSNYIWENQCFPDIWSRAVGIPLAKPNKDR